MLSASGLQSVDHEDALSGSQTLNNYTVLYFVILSEKSL
jgi:hypothetical protein